MEKFLDLVAETPTEPIRITVMNSGDDYTEGFSFDVITQAVFTDRERDGLFCKTVGVLSKQRLKTQHFSFSSRVEAMQTIEELIEVDVPLSLIINVKKPENCGGILDCSCETKIGFVHENLDYEKYT